MTAPNPYCLRLQSKMNEYHEGEMSAFLERVMRLHLSSCEVCRREYALLDKTIDAVRNNPAPDVPAWVLRRVVESLSGPGGGSPESAEIQGFGFAEGLETT